MIDESSRAGRPSRRQFLGGVAASVGTVATAGCLGSVLSTASAREIEPEELSTPRKGTPGEFYTLLERNDIVVESLYRDGSDLVLEYASEAETEDESIREIEIITTVYNENLVKNDAGVEMLYAELTDPFDGQAYGWGVKTEWCKTYNAAVAGSQPDDEPSDTESSADDPDNETSGDTDTDDGDDPGSESTDDSDGGDDTAGTEDDGQEDSDGDDGTDNETDEADSEPIGSNTMSAMLLMSNVLNSRVYEGDVESESDD